MTETPIRVAVTGVQETLDMLCYGGASGDCFGSKQPVILQLLKSLLECSVLKE